MHADEDERAEWYGWQNLSVDAAAFLLFAGAVGVNAIDEDANAVYAPMWIASVPTFVLGSPIVHWVHGNVGLGVVSLGLRSTSALLALFGVVQHAVACGDVEAEGYSCNDGTGLMVFGGIVAVVAIAIDAALGHERRAHAQPRSRLRPHLALGARAAWLELRGDL